jgi:hypothetical protein
MFTVAPDEETGGLIGGDSIRYLVPTLGFRAIL